MKQLNEKIINKSESLPDTISVDNVDNVVIPLNKANYNQISCVVPELAVSLSQAKERIMMLQSFVKEMMIPGIDYGMVPGCSKPSLYKSGAEKLCDIFGFSKQIEVINRLENWEKGIFAYEVKAILINKRTSCIEAEGIGSCNSREKKFKNQDSYTIVNTLLKMAKKRALIDAVLSATRSSGIFTQDIEDFESDTKYKKSIKKPSLQLASKDRLKILYALVKEINMPVVKVKILLNERYSVNNSCDLTKIQVEDMINLLSSMKAK